MADPKMADRNVKRVLIMSLRCQDTYFCADPWFYKLALNSWVGFAFQAVFYVKTEEFT